MDDYVTTLVSALRRAVQADPESYKVVVFFPTAKLARFFAEFLAVALEGVVLYQHSSFSGESLNEDEKINSLLIDFNLQPFLGAPKEP